MNADDGAVSRVRSSNLHVDRWLEYERKSRFRSIHRRFRSEIGDRRRLSDLNEDAHLSRLDGISSSSRCRYRRPRILLAIRFGPDEILDLELVHSTVEGEEFSGVMSESDLGGDEVDHLAKNPLSLGCGEVVGVVIDPVAENTTDPIYKTERSEHQRVETKGGEEEDGSN